MDREPPCSRDFCSGQRAVGLGAPHAAPTSPVPLDPSPCSAAKGPPRASQSPVPPRAPPGPSFPSPSPLGPRSAVPHKQRALLCPLPGPEAPCGRGPFPCPRLERSPELRLRGSRGEGAVLQRRARHSRDEPAREELSRRGESPRVLSHAYGPASRLRRHRPRLRWLEMTARAGKVSALAWPSPAPAATTLHLGVRWLTETL